MNVQRIDGYLKRFDNWFMRPFRAFDRPHFRAVNRVSMWLQRELHVSRHLLIVFATLFGLLAAAYGYHGITPRDAQDQIVLDRVAVGTTAIIAVFIISRLWKHVSFELGREVKKDDSRVVTNLADQRTLALMGLYIYGSMVVLISFVGKLVDSFTELPWLFPLIGVMLSMYVVPCLLSGDEVTLADRTKSKARTT